MNILAQAIPGNTYAGFQRAVQNDGHRWVWWEEDNTPAFDVFDEVRPDIVFCTSWTSSLNKCVNEFNVTSVFGDKNIPFVFVVRKSNNTITTFNFEYLVDNLIYYVDDEPPMNALACDVGVACRPNKTALNLCADPRELNIKIISETPWSVSQYLGFMSIHQKREFYRASSIVMVDDVTEAVKVMACGSLPVSVIPIDSLTVWHTIDHTDIIDYIYNVIDSTTLYKLMYANTVLGFNQQLEHHSYVDAWSTIKRTLWGT
jgi:hypothetical protein